MSTTVKTGWLKDKDGDKFAPKTYTSQVYEYDNTSLDEKLQNIDKELDKLENAVISPIVAEVGQQLIVKKVDENGKPIDWEYVERPCYIDELEVLFDEIIHFSNGSLQRDIVAYSMNYKFANNLKLEQGESYIVQTDNGSTLVMCKYLSKRLCLDASSVTYLKNGAEYIHIFEDGIDAYDMLPYTMPLKITHVKAKYLDTDLIPELAEKLNKPDSDGYSGYVLKSNGYGGTYWGSIDINSYLSNYVKTDRYATSSQVGLVRTNASYGTNMNGQYIQVYPASLSEIDNKSSSYKPITPETVDYAVRAGLTNNSLTWTDAQKKKAREVIGAVSIDDIPEQSSSVQSDWDQSDETADDYIKNRTHYDSRDSDICMSQIVNLGGFGLFNDISVKLYDKLISKDIEDIFVDGRKIVYDGESAYDGINYIAYNVSDTSDWALLVDKESVKAYVNRYALSNGVLVGTVSVSYTIKGSLKQLDEKFIPDSIPKVSVAEVGQILSVKAVDENDRPTEWEVVDAPTGSGGDGYSPIATVEQTETGATISIKDKNGTTTAVVNHGEDGKDGKTPYIDEEGFVVCGETPKNKTLLGEVVVTGHRKIQPLAIDYATGIITVDDCSFLPSENVRYTHSRVCIRKHADAFYPNNIIPSEIYGGIGIEKISDNTLYLYATNTKIETYAENNAIDLSAWYIEYSELNHGSIAVNLSDIEYGNHLEVEVFCPSAEIATVIGMCLDVTDKDNVRYLNYGATNGIRASTGADAYSFDSVRSLYINTRKGNAMPSRYNYDLRVDNDFIRVIAKNIVASSTADDKIPVYNIAEKAFLIKNNGLGTFKLSLGTTYGMLSEGSYLRIWEVHD